MVLRKSSTSVMVCGMRDWLVLIAHLIITTIRTIAPGGARAVIAESLLLKHQLLILNRSRKKAPGLRALDRILLGLGAILVSPRRILKVAVAIRPATLLRFHRALVRRKYQWLFSAKTGRRPGPKGPSKELIAAVLEIKRLNPRFGCPRIAQQSYAFGLEIDKDVVRRILANHHFPKPGGEGPSCLALIRSSSGLSEPFGASISTRPSSGTAATSIGSWIDSPPITTSGVSTPDWVDGRPSSDAARLCANRRIYMTSPGNPTVPVSSTRQLLRDQQFAIVRRRSPSSVAHDRCKARHSEKLCTVPRATLQATRSRLKV